MTLTAIYAGRVASALTAAVPAAALASAWYAGHPPAQQDQDQQQAREATAAELAAASAFLAAMSAPAALGTALGDVLTDLWAEGWTLGEVSAESLVTGKPADWREWTPGDADAAREAASDHLAAFLAVQRGIPLDIAGTYADQLGELLATAAAQGWSDAELAGALNDVLGNDGHSRLVAHTEMSRSQFSAADELYRANGIDSVDVITMNDDRVCPVCEALQDANPHDIRDQGVDGLLPVHPFDRCVAVPAARPAAGSPADVMAALLRRVLSDGYVPVQIGRDQ